MANERTKNVMNSLLYPWTVRKGDEVERILVPPRDEYEKVLPDLRTLLRESHHLVSEQRDQLPEDFVAAVERLVDIDVLDGEAGARSA